MVMKAFLPLIYYSCVNYPSLSKLSISKLSESGNNLALPVMHVIKSELAGRGFGWS